MTKKRKLMAIRKACKERGVKLIEVTHPDGRKTRIGDRDAIAAAMDALNAEPPRWRFPMRRVRRVRIRNYQ